MDENGVIIDMAKVITLFNAGLLALIEQRNVAEFEREIRIMEGTIALARGRMEQALAEPSVH